MTNKIKILSIAAVFLAVITASSCMNAERPDPDNGGDHNVTVLISGTVVNIYGEGIEGITVTLVNNNASVTTNAAGFFLFENLKNVNFGSSSTARQNYTLLFEDKANGLYDSEVVIRNALFVDNTMHDVLPDVVLNFRNVQQLPD